MKDSGLEVMLSFCTVVLVRGCFCMKFISFSFSLFRIKRKMLDVVSDYTLLSWRQSMENPGIDINISVPSKESCEPRKFKVIATGETLEVFLNDAKVISWTLFDAVLDEAEWETRSDELCVALTKATPDPWKSALRNPVEYPQMESAEAVMLSDNVLNGILNAETCSYALFASRDEADPDAILEGALEEDAPEGTRFQYEKAHYQGLIREGQILREGLAEVENKEIVEKVISYGEQVIATRSKEVSMHNILDATMLELIQHKLRTGDTVETEDEPFANDEDTQTGDELFGNGLLALDRQDAVEGLHLLRVAALKHDHAQSVINLVRLYMESGMEAKALQILIQSARRSTDPLINFTTAQMFDNGVNGLQPLFALALYFYQRAASQGESTAMCFASALHLRGACTATEAGVTVPSSKHAEQWMQHALQQGSIFAYKLQLEKHLVASNVAPHPMVELLAKSERFSPDPKEAKKYYQLLSDTSKEMLKQIPQVETRMQELCKPTMDAVQLEYAIFNEKTESVVENTPAPVEELVQVTEVVAEPPQETVKPRATKLGRVSRSAREGMDPFPSKSKETSSISRAQCENLALYAALASSAYVLSFPIRVVAIPWVFKTIDDILSVFA